MPLVSETQLPPPTNWQAFESLCHQLWQDIWMDPCAKKHGRNGQNDHGVDVYGNPNQGSECIGIQCKGKDKFINDRITEKSILEEIAKAEQFKPMLTRYIFATTAARDSKTQEIVRLISKERKNRGAFSVDIFFWEDIREEVGKRLNVCRAIYPEFFQESNQTNLSQMNSKLVKENDSFKKFEAEYLRQLSREFSRLRMIGVRDMRDVKQELDVAYVSLLLKDHTETNTKPRVADNVLESEKLLGIRGPAGSGKSTLLSWIALKCSQLDDHQNTWKGRIPYFVPLRRLANQNRSTPDLAELTRYRIDPNIWPHEPPEGWVIATLASERAVLLLDGVDELPIQRRDEFWEWLDDFVDRYPGNRIYVTSRYFAGNYRLQDHPKQVVSPTDIFSRPNFSVSFKSESPDSVLPPVTNGMREYLKELLGKGVWSETVPFMGIGNWGMDNFLFEASSIETAAIATNDSWKLPKGFVTADLQEMTDDDIGSFITNWHRAVGHLESDDETKMELSSAGIELPQKLCKAQNRRVRELCRTPLLCAVVCSLHWKDAGYLPSRRIDLYERCIAMLLEERDNKRKIPRPEGALSYLTIADKEMLIQRLALSMMRNKARGSTHQIEITREIAETWIKPHIRSCDDERVRECAPDQILDYLLERSGVLREPSPGWVDFQHRTFQEYMAACAAGALYEVIDLAERVHDDQWHETIIMSAGTKTGGVPFGNALVNELLQRGESSSEETRCTCFVLCVACLETANQIDIDIRAHVLARLGEIVPPQDATQAKWLSAAGDAVLSLLEYERLARSPESIKEACARTIAFVGTEAAAKMLELRNGYGVDDSNAVLSALCSCDRVHPLRIKRIIDSLQLASQDLPDNAWVRIRACTDLTPLTEHPQLQRLFLNNWENIYDLSELGKLKELRELHLEGTPINHTLEAIANLEKLESLDLEFDEHKVVTPGSEPWTPGEHLVERLSLGNLFTGSLQFSLRQLVLRGFSGVLKVPELACLSELRVCALLNFADLTGLDALAQMDKLRVLCVAGAYLLNDLADSKCLQSLECLRLVNCNLVSDLSKICVQPNIRHLSLRRCSLVENLEPIQNASELVTLDLRGSLMVSNLSPLASLSKLELIDLTGCFAIESFEPLLKLPKLARIRISSKMRSILPKELLPLVETKLGKDQRRIGLVSIQ